MDVRVPAGPRSIRTPLLLVVAALSVSATGCGFDLGYAAHAVLGQLDLLWNTITIDDAMNGDSLTDEQRAKLQLVQDVRRYAHDTIGLYIENSYTQYFDAGDRPVAYNLSASRQDALDPYLWSFPFIGAIPYLGYFDVNAAQDHARRLREQGFDTYTYEIEAYSIGALLPNPVLSPMLERDDIDLVSTVFHELLHATIAQSDNNSAEDNTFNESLGTFVGRQATLQYHRDRFPDAPERIQAATERFEDADRFGRFALELFDELDAFYSSDLTAEEKTAGREAVFQAARDRFESDVLPLMHHPDRYERVQDLPTNNAYILLLARYNLELNVFGDVFTTTGESWPMALQVFRLAAANDGSPFDYLRQWVKDRRPAAAIPQQ